MNKTAKGKAKHPEGETKTGDVKWKETRELPTGTPTYRNINCLIFIIIIINVSNTNRMFQ